MLNSAEFSKRLDKILDFYGLTASALAAEINFNRSTISHLVSGRNKPSLEFVMKLLQKFPELEMDWLVFGKGSFPPSSKVDTISKFAPPLSKIEDSLLDVLDRTNVSASGKSSHKKVERIVFFFSDGTFEVYEN